MTFRPIAAGLLCATLGLAACDEQTTNTVGGAAAGAGIGMVSAQLLGASDAWTVAAGAAGASAGALYARNRSTGNCAFYTGRTLPNGQPEVQVRPCP